MTGETEESALLPLSMPHVSASGIRRPVGCSAKLASVTEYAFSIS